MNSRKDRITIIKCGWILTQNDKRDILRPGYIAFKGHEIIYTGENEPESYRNGHVERIDASHCMAIPGLINGHCHTGMTLLRGMADDMPLKEWLEQKVWPMEQQLSEEHVSWGARLAMIEMIRSGTTCFNDMYWYNRTIAQVCSEMGMRGTIAGPLIETSNGNDIIRDALEFHTEWNDHDSGLIKTRFGPHAVYTCSRDFLEKTAGAAEEADAGIHIHLSETEHEIRDCADQNDGVTPVELLLSTGILKRPVTAAHCIHISDNDLTILDDHSVIPVHNPSSNMKLASGIMPLAQMHEKGLRVALGTDSAVSNNNLSMLQEMKLASLLQKISHGRADVMPAGKVLDMATRNGAAAAGYTGKIGQLTPEYFADIVLLNTEGAHTAPFTHPVSHLVYSMHPGDVDTVIIHGRTILKEGSFTEIDEDEVKAKVIKSIQHIKT